MGFLQVPLLDDIIHAHDDAKLKLKYKKNQHTMKTYNMIQYIDFPLNRVNSQENNADYIICLI